MLSAAFPRFGEFSFELRSKIWEYATADQLQDIGQRRPPWFDKRVPPWFENPWDDKWPYGREIKAPLSVCIRDPYNRKKRRFEEGDFERFVDSLSLSTVCYEARIHVAKFCQLLVPHITCDFTPAPTWSLQPPKDSSRPILIRNMHCQTKMDDIKYFVPRPTIVTVEMMLFKSAEDFVKDVSLFFGNRVERLILVLVKTNGSELESAYWADSSAPSVKDDIEIIVEKDSETDRALMSVTREGQLHISESFLETGTSSKALAYHLLKINEMFNFSSEILPHLEHIEVNLEIQAWTPAEGWTSKFVMVYKRDARKLVLTASERLGWPLITPGHVTFFNPI